MEIHVQKYGGSSLATTEKIIAVADQIAERHKKGESIIVVCSAMGNSTDSLIELAYKVSPTPSRRELDMLLSTGERVSMALLSMALQDRGCPAISFTGSQAGILTDESHSDARISEVKPIRVKESLEQGKVVVLAGFQGVNPKTKEITTLGRGGSDTTAVAMAAHFKAKSCEMLKDVEGVFTADPHKIDSAKPIPELSYDQLYEMCFWGSQVVHTRAIELAKQLSVPMFIGSATSPQKGTQVTKEGPMYEENVNLSINTIEPIYHFAVESLHLNEGLAKWTRTLSENDFQPPRLLASTFDSEKGQTRLMCHGSNELLNSIEEFSRTQSGITSLNLVLAGVTVTGNGTSPTDTQNLSLELLTKENIQIFKTIQSPMSFTFFVDSNEKDKAAKTLHRLL